MRHQVVKRLTLALTAVIALSALLFAWLVRDEPASVPTRGPSVSSDDERMGAALFERYCGACHAAADLRPALGSGAAARADWEQFLLDHGDADLEEDRHILDFLASGEEP